MAQDVFCSVYTKDYKTWENVERPPMARGINIAEDPEKYVKFLNPSELQPGQESADVIKQLHGLWRISTYRADYCGEGFTGLLGSEAEADGSHDELMESMERVLNPPDRKLLPPPDTSRVVFGYCPLRRFRSGRTFYTDVHSRPAYERLRRFVVARGLGRLNATPVDYPEPDYSTPPCRQGKKPPTPTWIHLRPDPYS